MWIILWFIFIIIMSFLTWKLPLLGRVLLFIVNLFLPEGVPYIDEIIQLVGIVSGIWNRPSKKIKNKP